MQPARRVQPRPRFDREQAFEPAVADQAAHDPGRTSSRQDAGNVLRAAASPNHVRALHRGAIRCPRPSIGGNRRIWPEQDRYAQLQPPSPAWRSARCRRSGAPTAWRRTGCAPSSSAGTRSSPPRSRTWSASCGGAIGRREEPCVDGPRPARRGGTHLASRHRPERPLPHVASSRIASSILLPVRLVASAGCYPGGGQSGWSMAGRLSMATRRRVGGGDPGAVWRRRRVSRRRGSWTSWWRCRAITASTRSGCWAGAKRGHADRRTDALRRGDREALIVLWEASDRICSKRLKPLIPVLLPALERHGRMRLGDDARARLLAVSAATMDRLLSDVRLVARGGQRRRAGSARRCGGRSGADVRRLE